MEFKILNLDLEMFANICHELEEKVSADGYMPDKVIGIPRGGSRMLPYMFCNTGHDNVTLIRPHYSSIKKLVKHILYYTPRFINDWLRKAEAHWHIKRNGHMASTTIILPELSPGIKNILLIDDAVDSGATLNAIVNKFAKEMPDINVRTAAITVTNISPTHMPDYYIFNNSTLIRTPWSIDSRYNS